MHRKNILQGALLPYRNCPLNCVFKASQSWRLYVSKPIWDLKCKKSDVDILDLIDVISSRDRPQHEALSQGEEAQEDEVVWRLPSHSCN